MHRALARNPDGSSAGIVGSVLAGAGGTGWLLRLLGALFPLLELAALTALENTRPLRRSVEDKARRFVRNSSIAALGSVTVLVLELPIVLWLARLVERHGWGLVPALPIGSTLRTVVAVILMDYTLYAWHVLTHKSPHLWRIHRVHHCDLDLDASTAVRFHFFEHIASLPYRAAQVLVIGVSPSALVLWRSLLMANILFHHSNVRLPLAAERWIARFVMTPRLHGIHHSSAMSDRESNWSSGLTVWDRLHGTYREDVDQERITIGLAELREPDSVRFARLIVMPFDPPTR